MAARVLDRPGVSSAALGLPSRHQAGGAPRGPTVGAAPPCPPPTLDFHHPRLSLKVVSLITKDNNENM